MLFVSPNRSDYDDDGEYDGDLEEHIFETLKTKPSESVLKSRYLGGIATHGTKMGRATLVPGNFPPLFPFTPVMVGGLALAVFVPFLRLIR